MDVYHKILEKYWGYPAFRPLQEDIIHSVCAGKDTLGLMPTGGGKSITFQVPALAMEGICIVVTPLIALMKDQVENLRRVGIKATAVYSGMSRQEIITQLENCIFGGPRSTTIWNSSGCLRILSPTIKKVAFMSYLSSKSSTHGVTSGIGPSSKVR